MPPDGGRLYQRIHDSDLSQIRFAQDALQIRSQIVDELSAAAPYQPACPRLRKRSFNMAGQLSLAPGNGDQAHFFELSSRLHLVIVAMLPAQVVARHDDDWYTSIQAGEYRPRSGMSDYQLRSRDCFGILRPIKRTHTPQVRIVNPTSPYLCENLRPGKSTVGPIIDGSHEPLERKLSADCDEDHSSEPR